MLSLLEFTFKSCTADNSQDRLHSSLLQPVITDVAQGDFLLTHHKHLEWLIFEVQDIGQPFSKTNKKPNKNKKKPQPNNQPKEDLSYFEEELYQNSVLLLTDMYLECANRNWIILLQIYSVDCSVKCYTIIPVHAS